MLQKLKFLFELENEGAILGHCANSKMKAVFSLILPFSRSMQVLRPVAIKSMMTVKLFLIELGQDQLPV